MNKSINFQKLATTKKLLPYFKKIDDNRFYSNFGPLHNTATKIIENLLKFPGYCCTLTSSGDASLNAVFKLIKQKNPTKKIVICPSFAFFADANNIFNNGFKPYFVDINKYDLTYDNNLLKKVIEKKKNLIAAIVYVSPFGYPIPIQNLNYIYNKYKIPIIYDAADTFLNLKNKIPLKEIFVTCSFHPTKTLPGSESGLILSPKKYKNYFKTIINHEVLDLKKNKGKDTICGFNGKASEYDCAILMGNMKKLKKEKNQFNKKNLYFKKNLNNKFSFQPNYGKWASNKLVFFTNINKFKLKKLLNTFRVKLYKIWGDKCLHEYKSYEDHYKTVMTNSLDIKKKNYSFFIDERFNNNFLKKLCKGLNSL
jgi:dTDP-4-amino-4,6-dideoxygalactose transaminase